MTARRALWGLIVSTGLLRLAWAACLGPGNDEAYHYLFTVHRDWSYFDHPPMVAIVEQVGIALAGGRVSAFSLRIGFIGLFAGSTWLMARLGTRLYGPRAGLLAALALNLTAYYGLFASTWALPDGPLLFFWLLTLDRLAAALDSPGRARPWLGVGLAWGGAMLSKYHAIFLPSGALLYLVLEPSARRWLRRPGPYLAVGVGLAAFSPVIYWNATHDWASFAFQGGRALGAVRFRPETLAAAILGQAVYLLPWIWVPMVTLLASGFLRLVKGREIAAADRFLLCQAIVPAVVFLAVACIKPILPHWTLVGFLAIFPMFGRDLEARWRANPRRIARRMAFMAGLPPAIAALILVQAHWGLFQKGVHGSIGLVRVSRDPTLDMYGWDEVGHELRRRGLLDQPGTFLFTSAWYYSGQLAFAVRETPSTPILCYHGWDSRSFAFWSRPEDWVGRDGILVAINDHINEPHCYEKWFRRIEPIGSFEVSRAGSPVRKIRLFRCEDQVAPFPFDGSKIVQIHHRTAVAAPGRCN
jgi:hypothetical protein